MEEHKAVCQIRQQDGDDITCTCYSELDKILEQHKEWLRGIKTDRLIGVGTEPTKQQIKSLMLHIRDIAFLRTDPDINKMMLEFDRLVKEL